MSKGSARRPEDPDKEPGAYGRNYERIDWSGRARRQPGDQLDPNEYIYMGSTVDVVVENDVIFFPDCLDKAIDAADRSL